MPRPAFCLSGWAALSLSACGQAPSANQPRQPATAQAAQATAGNQAEHSPQRSEADLIALERAYAGALIRRDRAFLQAYYAPDWRGGNWLGFWTKATMLKAVLNARYQVRSMDLQDVHSRIIGNVGIVQGVSNEVTRVDGRDTSGRWTFTDVFEWRDGRWLAVASHTAELTGQQE